MKKFINTSFAAISVLSATYVQAVIGPHHVKPEELTKLASKVLGDYNKSVGRVWYKGNEKSTCPAAIIEVMRYGRNGALILTNRPKDIEFVEIGDVKYKITSIFEIKKVGDATLVGCLADKNFDTSSLPMNTSTGNILRESDLTHPRKGRIEYNSNKYLVGFGNCYDATTRQEMEDSKDLLKAVQTLPFYRKSVQDELIYSSFNFDSNIDTSTTELRDFNLIAALKMEPPFCIFEENKIPKWIKVLKKEEDLNMIGFARMHLNGQDYYMAKTHHKLTTSRFNRPQFLRHRNGKDIGADTYTNPDNDSEWIFEIDYRSNHQFAPKQCLFKKDDISKLIPTNKYDSFGFIDMDQYLAIDYDKYYAARESMRYLSIAKLFPGAAGPDDVGALIIKSESRGGFMASGVDLSLLGFVYKPGSDDIKDPKVPYYSGESQILRISNEIISCIREKAKEQPILTGYITLEGEVIPLSKLELPATVPQAPGIPDQEPILTMDSAASNNYVLVDSQTILTDSKLDRDIIGKFVKVGAEKCKVEDMTSDGSGIALIHLNSPVIGYKPISRYRIPLGTYIPDNQETHDNGSLCYLKAFDTDNICSFIGFMSAPSGEIQLTEEQQRFIDADIISQALQPIN